MDLGMAISTHTLKLCLGVKILVPNTAIVPVVHIQRSPATANLTGMIVYTLSEVGDNEPITRMHELLPVFHTVACRCKGLLIDTFGVLLELTNIPVIVSLSNKVFLLESCRGVALHEGRFPWG